MRRVVLTLLAALTVLALDALTPAGLAVWLLQVVLVWSATLWANRRQMITVTAVCATFILLGFWLSPTTGGTAWIDVSNLVLSLGTVAALTHSYLRRMSTEEARRTSAQELGQMIRILSGLLPMCAWCMKIRNGAGIWEPLETYICKNSPAEFTYAMCDKCATRFNH
jgi:hypothetical protein